MFRFSSLTSNKTKIIYIVTYIIYEGLYLLNPILIMNFINNIIDKNFKITFTNRHKFLEVKHSIISDKNVI